MNCIPTFLPRASRHRRAVFASLLLVVGAAWSILLFRYAATPSLRLHRFTVGTPEIMPAASPSFAAAALLPYGVLALAAIAAFAWPRRKRQHPAPRNDGLPAQPAASSPQPVLDNLNLRLRCACEHFHYAVDRCETAPLRRAHDVQHFLAVIPELVWRRALDAETAILLEENAEKLTVVYGHLRTLHDELSRALYLDSRPRLSPRADAKMP